MAAEAASATVFVVDDDQGLSRLIQKTLQREGFTVVTAFSGKEAIAWLEKNRADLMLLDLKMPGLSGLEVAQRAKEIQSAAILILTGSSAIEGALDVPGVGEFDFMLKTTAPEAVLERVAAAIK